jgi:hypothetical protein
MCVSICVCVCVCLAFKTKASIHDTFSWVWPELGQCRPSSMPMHLITESEPSRGVQISVSVCVWGGGGGEGGVVIKDTGTDSVLLSQSSTQCSPSPSNKLQPITNHGHGTLMSTSTAWPPHAGLLQLHGRPCNGEVSAHNLVHSIYSMACNNIDLDR